MKKAPAPAAAQAQGEFEVRVSGLSYQATKENIEEFFGEICQVTSANLLMDRETGRSKGLAFVKFATQADMDKAIANNRCEHMGRYLNIEQSQAREQRQQNGGNMGNQHLAGVSSTLFVGNLSFQTNEQTLQKAFGKINGIVSCRVAKD